MATLAGAAGDELEPRRDGLTRSRARFLLTVVALALFYSASCRLDHVPRWRVLARRFTREDRALARHCLDTVGLLDKAAVRADQLSGGQQQRVAIARALAQNARVILADEPVASLDPESADTVLQSLRSAVAAGVAVVASLHQVHRARAYADRILALRAGRLVEDVPTARLDVRSIEQIYARASARSEP